MWRSSGRRGGASSSSWTGCSTKTKGSEAKVATLQDVALATPGSSPGAPSRSHSGGTSVRVQEADLDPHPSWGQRRGAVQERAQSAGPGTGSLGSGALPQAKRTHIQRSCRYDHVQAKAGPGGPEGIGAGAWVVLMGQSDAPAHQRQGDPPSALDQAAMRSCSPSRAGRGRLMSVLRYAARDLLRCLGMGGIGIPNQPAITL